MPRTYAPKPAYAVKYWHSHNLTAPSVDILRLIQARAERYYGSITQGIKGWVIEGDSRTATPFSKVTTPVQWIITSPPYYGMRTYLPDQWLRLWFLGGPPTVDYTNRGQLSHTSPDFFASELTRVWQQVASVSTPQAQLVVRFGGINDRRADPVSIIQESFVASGWHIKETHPAGSASSGRRQALHFSSTPAKAIEEIDVWAIRSS
jgi:hypothetical protein